jgi:pimeloyl-ACP methyl ester carboxylesterase
VDLGGAVALRLAVTNPARVSHLVLVNSLTRASTPAADVRGLRRSIARFTLQIANGLMGAAPLLTPLLEGSVADREYMPWRLVARYLAPYVGQDGVRHFMALASSVAVQDMADVELDDVRAPTLIVRGDADQWVEDEVAVRLSGAIPSSRLVRLPGVGRLVPEEAPDQLVGLILDFIEGRGAPITGADEAPASASD